MTSRQILRCRPLSNSKSLFGQSSSSSLFRPSNTSSFSFTSSSRREFHQHGLLPMSTRLPVPIPPLDDKKDDRMNDPLLQPIRYNSHSSRSNQSFLGTNNLSLTTHSHPHSHSHQLGGFSGHGLASATFQNDFSFNNNNHHHYNHRQITTSAITDLIPEFAKQYSIWGGSAIILKTLHAQNIPYWGCMSLTNIFVRSSLLPLVIKGAKTSARFANVAPEVQFLVSSYTKDTKTLKDGNAAPSQRLELLVASWQSLRGIYKLHGVNPFDVLKSPLMQIPVFWYFSVDIRKVINGGNPELAQDLTESGFLWVMDLTEPDPWYGLPILSGMFLYLNVEMAVGRKTLSGETASKSNIARYLKDGFQSLAVLMPCLMAQSPAGVQVYLLTSFIFTLFQGAALRNDGFRQIVGLPLSSAPLPEGKFVKEFIQYNKLERQTYGILSPKFQSTFRPYAEVMSPGEMKRMEQNAKETKKKSGFDGIGVYAAQNQPGFQPSPVSLIVNQIAESVKMGLEQEKHKGRKRISSDQVTEIAPSPEEIMDAANKGEKPAAPIKITAERKPEQDATLNAKKLAAKQKKGPKSKRRK